MTGLGVDPYSRTVLFILAREIPEISWLFQMLAVVEMANLP